MQGGEDAATTIDLKQAPQSTPSAFNRSPCRTSASELHAVASSDKVYLHRALSVNCSKQMNTTMVAIACFV